MAQPPAQCQCSSPGAGADYGNVKLFKPFYPENFKQTLQLLVPNKAARAGAAIIALWSLLASPSCTSATKTESSRKILMAQRGLCR